MCLLFTLWRMNKYQSINQSIKKSHLVYYLLYCSWLDIIASKIIVLKKTQTRLYLCLQYYGVWPQINDLMSSPLAPKLMVRKRGKQSCTEEGGGGGVGEGKRD